MASIIASLAISGSRKPDGSPNAGGRVFLSLIDSPNTNVTGYADRNKNAALTLNGGGYILDQAGKAAIFVETACRVRTEDSNGVAVDAFIFEPTVNEGLVEVKNVGFTGIDPVSGALVAGGRTTLAAVLSNLYASLGGLDGKFQGLYGTGSTNIKAELEQIGLTPQRFGAKGDGVSDDTTPFLLLAAATAASGIPVYLPKATYIITSAITFAAQTVIRGAGRLASVIRQNNAAANGIIVGSSSVLSDFSINAGVATSGTGLISDTSSFINNMVINGSWAIAVSANSNVSIRGPSVLGGTVSLNFTGTPFTVDPNISMTGTFPSNLVFFGQSTKPISTSVATGGNITPVAGGVSYNKITATGVAPAITVNSVTPVGTVVGQNILILDCIHGGSGAASAFTMNAIFKTSAAIAPTVGLRVIVTFTWDFFSSTWIESSRTGGSAGF